MQALGSYDWPGNVRELENAIERACALSDTEIIRLDNLPPAVAAIGRAQPPDPATTDTKFFDLPAQEAAAPNGKPPANPAAPLTNLREFMREQELAYINRALSQAGGDKERAAQALGVSLATLYRRLAEE